MNQTKTTKTTSYAANLIRDIKQVVMASNSKCATTLPFLVLYQEWEILVANALSKSCRKILMARETKNFLGILPP